MNLTASTDELASTEPRTRRRWPWLAAGLIVGLTAGALISQAARPTGAEAESYPTTYSQSDNSPDQRADAGLHDAPTSDAETEHAEDGHAHEHGPSPAGWLQAADGFGKTFTNTSLGQGAWFDALSSWLTSAQAEMYADVPIENIPVGDLTDVYVADPAGALFTSGRLTYDSGLVLIVGLTYDAASAGWLVASVSREN